MEEVWLDAGGLRVFALAEGPRDGRLVLCLHGFPEFSRSWRHQLPALSAAGFRAVAPDLRGYGRSGKAGPYDLRTLAGDVAALVRALERERAIVVGHDWGGAVAWAAASLEPEVVERLVVLNCPHPGTLAHALRTSPAQLRRSRYMLFFQLPSVPERLLTRNGAAEIARAIYGGSYARDAWSREELDHYRRAFLQPGAASAALGYYRAAFRAPVSLPRAAIRAPTLVLWGVHDRFLGRELVEPDALRPWFVPGNEPEVRPIAGAGHFVQNEAPVRVNRELLGWLEDPS